MKIHFEVVRRLTTKEQKRNLLLRVQHIPNLVQFMASLWATLSVKMQIKIKV